MKNFGLAPRILLGLGAVCLVLPITAGYTVSFLLLGWLVAGYLGRWFGQRRLSGADQKLTCLLAPLNWGIGLFLMLEVVSAVVAWQTSPYAPDLAVAAKRLSHLMVKHGLLWFVLSQAMRRADGEGWEVWRTARWFLLWLVVHFAYVIAQRQLGLDWTHGFSATLPPHRYAYGVYRVSGFMGHPLSLSYNLVLITLMALGFSTFRVPSVRTHRIVWAGIALLAFSSLLISGSRFPLLVVVAVLGVMEYRRIWTYKWYVAGAVGLAAWALWVEGSTLARVGELISSDVPFLERFPRFIFWKVHLSMFLDYPLAGVGLADVEQATVDYYRAIGVDSQMYSAHNIVLQTLADSGFIGLVGLLAFWIGFGRTAHLWGKATGNRGLWYIFLATIASGLLQNNLRDSEYLYALWFCTALLLVHGASLAKQVNDIPVKLDEHKKIS